MKKGRRPGFGSSGLLNQSIRPQDYDEWRAIWSSTLPSGPISSKHHRHRADRVRRARQAGVVRADRGFDPVEHPLGQLAADHELLGDHLDALAHRPVLWPVANDQVDLGQQAVLIGLEVVEERAARRLDTADAFARDRGGFHH